LLSSRNALLLPLCIGNPGVRPSDLRDQYRNLHMVRHQRRRNGLGFTTVHDVKVNKLC